MKRLFIILVMAITIQATAQTATSWFKSYTGTIGKTSFTMLLHRAGNDYDAYVYYMNTQQPYQLSALGQKSSTITLSGTAPGSNYDEKWVLKIAGKKVTGSFLQNKKTSVLTAEESSFEPHAKFVYTQHSEKLNKDKSAPILSFYQSGIWYEGNSGINKILWPNCINQAAGQYFITNKNSFVAGFKEEHKDLKPSDYNGMQSMYNRDTHGELLMSYISKNLLVFSSSSYEFSGGAHGNFGTGHYVIDRRNTELLSLQDVISDTVALIPLLEKYFRKMYKVEKNTSLVDAGLFQNQIPVTDNFFLTQKCIGFTYNPYEIGPYVMGQTTIYIPLDECKELISDKAKSILTDK